MNKSAREIEWHIRKVIFDDDFGGLIVKVEVNGKSYDFMQQYYVDNDGDIMDGPDCWTYIDGLYIGGAERSESCMNLNILKKLTMFGGKNDYEAADKAWELFNAVMKEAEVIYKEDKEV